MTNVKKSEKIVGYAMLCYAMKCVCMMHVANTKTLNSTIRLTLLTVVTHW